MGPVDPDAAGRGTISLEELASMDVIHGPRRADPGTYDAWTRVLQAVDPRFGFTDPPFRSSLPLTLAFAAAGDRSAAVLTGPSTVVNGPPSWSDRGPRMRAAWPRWTYSTIR